MTAYMAEGDNKRAFREANAALARRVVAKLSASGAITKRGAEVELIDTPPTPQAGDRN